MVLDATAVQHRLSHHYNLKIWMNPLELSSQTTATNERGMSRRCQATVNNLTIEANVGSTLLMTGT